MILAQLTDLHVRPRGMAAMRACETNMLTERALRAAASFRPKIDAVLITGDLAANGLNEEYRELAAMLRRTIDVPVYVIPGNHDARGPLKGELCHLPGVAEDAEFIQFAIDDFPVRVVMLDTLVPNAAHGELCARRLRWLDKTLSAVPDKPTIVAMHHPPFLCGIRHMDKIVLNEHAPFISVIAKHRQVQRILCGHHHRPITAPVAHTIASIGPSVAHQVELDLFSDNVGLWNLEPPAFQLHVWIEPPGMIVSHTAYVEQYPGPYPFFDDPKA